MGQLSTRHSNEKNTYRQPHTQTKFSDKQYTKHKEIIRQRKYLHRSQSTAGRYTETCKMRLNTPGERVTRPLSHPVFNIDNSNSPIQYVRTSSKQQMARSKPFQDEKNRSIKRRPYSLCEADRSDVNRGPSLNSHTSERPTRLSLPEIGEVFITKSGKIRSVRRQSPNITEKEFPSIKEYVFAQSRSNTSNYAKASVKTISTVKTDSHRNEPLNNIRCVTVSVRAYEHTKPSTNNNGNIKDIKKNNQNSGSNDKSRRQGQHENKRECIEPLSQRIVEGQEDLHFNKRVSFHESAPSHFVVTYT